ncbi:MAG: hypothetical protein UY48_C0052G0003 [Candidatus Gottesmanbacteria bacterium GW2011_GWB1_49_7]|uniref:Uncharacterized protein n=1 Tax=Candidatus Gottesmanbacteria bacterium GW2011_GWB1_49_7 TaxID=1618448 RepID=A0A0G1YTY1_9BACT|nr:MAG: hypothetical protein UY48_C0052G0003 [Candidatus Gottesmanbacteria bacterium GW2011_GWB1_49_7]
MATLTDNADTGDFVLSGDLTVTGGDIVGAATTNLLNAATTVNLGSTAVTRAINIGTGTNADTINIGTGATTADVITFGNTTQGIATTFTVNSGAQTATPVTFDLDEVTSVTAFDLSVDALTTGTGLLIDDGTAAGLSSGTLLQVQSATTDTTAITDGMLAYFNWSGAATKSGDLVRINIGTNLFNVTDDGSSLFSVSETGVTSAVPHSFTAAGDVSIAYDLQFTNQTSSSIKTNAPLTIEAGESSENNNLTLKTYGTGKIITDGAFSVNSQSALSASATPSVGGGSYYTTPGTQTFTNFTDGVAGQLIFIEHVDATTDYDCTASNLNCGTTDITTTASGDASAWIYDGTDWHLIAFMDDSDNHETGNGFDLAELFVSTETLQQGDVVSIHPTENIKVQKALSGDNQRVIGVVSTSPGLILGEQIEGVNAYAIALTGRVPVKVNQNSLPIVQGDFIGASSELGKGQKISSGFIVGRALESWTSNSGKDTVEIFVNPIYVNPTDSQLQDSIATLQNDMALMQSQLDLGQEASSSASFTDLSINNLTVLGDAILGNTVINGKLNVGTLQFDNTNNSIDAIGVLKIQPLALANVEFLGGLITFDTQGNIKAREITAEKYNVRGASAGEGTLLSNEYEVFIYSVAVTPESLVLVTPKTLVDYPLVVTEKQEGIGFKVKMSVTSAEDTLFDWFIVDKVSSN